MACGAIAIAWLAVRAAAIDALIRRNPIAAATFSPHDPRVPIRLAMVEFRQKQGAVDPALSQAAIFALQRAPLVEEPFILAAITALVERREERSEALLEEALARNPRSRLAHILLLDRYLRTGRMTEATAEIAAVQTFVPDTARVLVPQLAKFALDPKTSKSLSVALESYPALRGQLLEHLATSGADLSLILAYAPAPRGPSSQGDVASWQQLLIDRAVTKGDLATAEQLWTRFSGLGLPDTSDGMEAESFRRAVGPPPFFWSFASNAAGAAEPVKAGLEVQYYGRSDGEFSSRLLRLRPGRYQISFRALGDTPERGSSLSWQVTCNPGGRQLAAVAVAQLTYAPKAFAATFDVPPSGCPSQWLKLVGTAGEFPATHQVTIPSLVIRKEGGS